MESAIQDLMNSLGQTALTVYCSVALMLIVAAIRSLRS